MTRRNSSRDHVPSKLFLKHPFPDNLATVRICRDCNMNFSPAEEYVGAFLGMVLTENPDEGPPHYLEKKIDSNLLLHDHFVEQMTVHPGSPAALISLAPDQAKLETVISKNARGHLHIANPLVVPIGVKRVTCCAIDALPESIWSLALPPLGQWVNVQDGNYRFHVLLSDTTIVRSMVCEYLYTETIFDL